MPLATGLLEFRIPPYVSRYASFLFSFLGRGICEYFLSARRTFRSKGLTILPVYIFIGSIILTDNWPRYVSGAIIGVVGVGYVVLEFIPSIEPPENMREADQGWGAEQV